MRELRRLRETCGLGPEDAAARLAFSRSKLYRIENGRTRISADDLEEMLDLYGVGSPDRDALITLGRESRRRGWWTPFRDVFSGTYIGLEAEASSIRMYSSVVPGPFQTHDYARAVIAATGPWFGGVEVERRVAARLARQAALFTGAGPEMHVVIDESAFRRPAGDATVMGEQLAQLVTFTERPGITVQVLPFGAGVCAGIDGDFVVLGFPDPQDPSVAYTEGLFGGLYQEIEVELERYALVWARLTSCALSPAESHVMIKKIAEDYVDQY